MSAERAASELLAGKVAIVTGGGHGIGRGHAMHLARLGAKVVVNDLGTSLAGSGSDASVAQVVVDKIVGAGGEAVADGNDVADWEGSQRLIQRAIDHFGRLDVLVNNAAIFRDKFIVDMTEDDWDSVVRVHLKGTFATLRHAASYWKSEFEAGRKPRASVINTSSRAATLPDRDQAVRPNYVAAKAGVAALSQVASYELYQYGIRVNTLCPSGFTRQPALTFGNPDILKEPEEYSGFDVMNPANNAPLVCWLASDLSAHVTGQTFQVYFGKKIIHVEPWRYGAEIEANGHLDDVETIGERMDTQVFGCREPWRKVENEMGREVESRATGQPSPFSSG